MPVKYARYLDWEDAFDVEFDDGLSFLEPHKTIRKANRMIRTCERFRTGPFKWQLFN